MDDTANPGLGKPGLEAVGTGGASPVPSFDGHLARWGLPRLRRQPADTLQINVGKRCNQACHHCHVDASPKRTESMSDEVAERTMAVLEQSPGVGCVDITGGAPELHPRFRWLVERSRELGRRVKDRCNLTILFEPGQEDLPDVLAANRVEVVASLPCYQSENVDRQRGKGVFDRSIAGLQLLGARGYGDPETGLVLDLVYNPVGAHLPPAQAALEARYREELGSRFGIRFNHLYTLTNMPIRRFADQLAREQRMEAYMALLVSHFNPATVSGLMCRTIVSVGYQGTLYDCDFNQMLELPIARPAARTVFELDSFGALEGAEIVTGTHCFGCTAGAGSSCGGALQPG